MLETIIIGIEQITKSNQCTEKILKSRDLMTSMKKAGGLKLLRM